MADQVNAQTGLNNFIILLSKSWSNQLKALLETKHLYQKVSIDPEQLRASVMKTVTPIATQPSLFHDAAKSALGEPIFPTDEQLFALRGAVKVPEPCLIVGNVKLFCSVCGSREAYRPIWFSDVTNTLLQPRSGSEKLKVSFDKTFQIFLLVYQCQRCEGKPETFIVRKIGSDLILEGRSPIEQVELPNFILDKERKWFRDAIIAYQTGKVLAAIFYLRTFIEQFARRIAKVPDVKMRGEEIMAAYRETLPPQHRDYMPSLGEWYEKLSEPLHAAREDSEVFESAKSAIEKHFDIRRVYDIDGYKQPEPATVEEDLKSSSAKVRNSSAV